jgi:hypothetical protein
MQARNPGRVRILVADDHEAVRKGVSLFSERSWTLKFVAKLRMAKKR